MSDCELCREPGGLVVHRAAEWRVVRVADPDFPAFYRLIWNAHVAEFSDLDRAARQRCMEAVAAVEGALREALAPAKINLASLGNVVPHLHWHVIPRYADDAHFPAPVWAQAQRTTDEAVLQARRALVPQLAEAIARRFAAR